MSQLIKVAGWTGEVRAVAIFIHGLGGHAYGTWQRGSDRTTFWPLWLATDVTGLTVYTLSYAAPASNWLGTAMPLQDRAVNISELLLGEPDIRERPITFICHSLGGLLVKQLMLGLQQQKDRRPEAAALLDQVKQVVFIATPHTGAGHGTLLNKLSFLAWPSAAARTLAANDPTLRQINVDYAGLADERRKKLRHRIFYETQQTSVGGIVDPASANPGLPGDPPIPIDADHITIAKPSSRSALLYRRTYDVVSEYPSDQTLHSTFAASDLPPLTVEQPWNIAPKLLRVAAIALTLIVGAKGVQGIFFPSPDSESVKLLRVQTKQLETEVRELRSAGKQQEAENAEATLAVTRRQIRGVQLLDAGKTDQAKAELNAAVKELDRIPTGSARARNQRGYLYKTLAQVFLTKDQREQADEYLGLALNAFEQVASESNASAEDRARAIHGIGVVKHVRGDLRGAIAEYDRAIAVFPRESFVWYDRFLAYLDLKDRDDNDRKEMRESLDQTKKRDPLSPTEVDALEDNLRRAKR